MTMSSDSESDFKLFIFEIIRKGLNKWPVAESEIAAVKCGTFGIFSAIGSFPSNIRDLNLFSEEIYVSSIFTIKDAFRFRITSNWEKKLVIKFLSQRILRNCSICWEGQIITSILKQNTFSQFLDGWNGFSIFSKSLGQFICQRILKTDCAFSSFKQIAREMALKVWMQFSSSHHKLIIFLNCFYPYQSQKMELHREFDFPITFH
jgi:hypothetical protein